MPLLTVRELIIELLQFNLDAKIVDDLSMGWSDDNPEQDIIHSKMRAEYVMLINPLTKQEEEL